MRTGIAALVPAKDTFAVDESALSIPYYLLQSNLVSDYLTTRGQRAAVGTEHAFRAQPAAGSSTTSIDLT